MFCFSTHQSTKSSIEDTEASLIASNIDKAFNVSVVIGAQDFICCRINLVNTSRSHFQNHRFPCITPVMFIAVIPLQRKLLLDIYTHTALLQSNTLPNLVSSMGVKFKKILSFPPMLLFKNTMNQRKVAVNSQGSCSLNNTF